MALQIDSSYPREGNAYTANVRAQFETARVEISALQDNISQLQGQIAALLDDNQKLRARQMAAAQKISPNPPDTMSPNYVTAGLDIVFTPTGSTRAYITAEGSLGNNSNGQQSFFQLLYGAGDPPAQGTDITTIDATLIGTEITITTTKAGESRPFSATALVTGLVVQTKYWVGAAYRCAGGVAQLSVVTVTAFELLDPLSATP